MTNKKRALKRWPNAFCRMSQLSGIYFVYCRPHGRIIAYEPSAQAAWKSVAKEKP